ncbi:hypothetical protein BJ170DRAFT_719207 [Xylariales sp. AK1849]|nr:hypothetical protein BJ170DRAFT_719207 [Xylariales sp. AK1849]
MEGVGDGREYPVNLSSRSISSEAQRSIVATAQPCINLVPLLAGFALISGAIGIAIPPPTGPHRLGVKRIEVDYTNTGDPVAPNDITTSFLATVFYPTAGGLKYKQEPYLDPATASLYENAFTLTNGSLSSLTFTAIRDAPVLSDQLAPTVIYASYGYTVIGLDHAYEQPFLRWPNGTRLYGLDIFFSGFTAESTAALQSIRINETVALLNNIPVLEKALGAPINQTHLGTFWGDLQANDSSIDTQRPVFLFGSAGHGGSEEGDVTWKTFPKWQTGWERLLNVNGSEHLDFSDETFWREVPIATNLTRGTIDGNRMMKYHADFCEGVF